jgi:hypothetical protein
VARFVSSWRGWQEPGHAVEAPVLRGKEGHAERVVHVRSGAVEVTGGLKPPDACHCTQCRKWSGHIYVGTDVPRRACTIYGEDNVTWYQSSEKVRRGFCSICGCSLFFDPLDRTRHDWIGVSMGTFDEPTDTHIAIHVFVAEKGDYHEVNDNVPQADTIPDHAEPSE